MACEGNAMTDLETQAAAVQALRVAMLCEENDQEGPFAEQHYLSALAYLELAQRELTLAHYHSVRERTRGVSR